MNKDVLKQGKMTESGRLKIKEIRKCEAKVAGIKTLDVLGRIVTGAGACAGFYSLVRALRGDFYNDNALLTYGTALLSLVVSFIASALIYNIPDTLEDYKYEIGYLEKKILYSSECQPKNKGL